MVDCSKGKSQKFITIRVQLQVWEFAITNVSMVDACHIVPFSEGYDDTLTNGIALCPNQIEFYPTMENIAQHRKRFNF